MRKAEGWMIAKEMALMRMRVVNMLTELLRYCVTALDVDEVGCDERVERAN